MVDFHRLLNYYIECIEIEAQEEFSFPSFKENDTFVLLNFSDNEWSSTNKTRQVYLPSALKRNLALNRETASLFYGWPLFYKPAIASNGLKYYWIEPLFLLKVEIINEDNFHELAIIKEWPKINDKILSRFAPTIEERIQIQESIGISEAETLPDEGLSYFWIKFNNLFQDLSLKSSENAIDISENTFFNKGIIFLSSAAIYHRLLLKELKTLRNNFSNSAINSTSLGDLITGHIQKFNYDFKPTQITSINHSQRNAIKRAFNNSISVVTGPPGTGKSQVVLNLMVNAFENNTSVLFTSKNNKAVDVVCERIFRAIKFPINLRLGSKTLERNYTIEFLDLLDSILSGSNKEEAVSRFRIEKQRFDDYKKEYYELLEKLNKIVEIRNKINELDQIIENLQSKLGKLIIEKLNVINFNQSDLQYQYIQNEIERLLKNKFSFIEKISVLFYPSFIHKKIHKYCLKLSQIIENVIPINKQVINDLKYYENLYSQILLAINYIKTSNHLIELSKDLNKYSLTELNKELLDKENKFISAAINYLEALGKYRVANLSVEDRRALTNYYSVMRNLSGEYPGDKAYALLKKQQEELFKQVKKILPVWSVTNLSAGGHFPLAPGIFDLLIVDEASQSDIASAIPLLFRAKKAIIIGDPNQLKHISKISKAQDSRILNKHGLLGVSDANRFTYTTQSLFHCARGIVDENSITLLNEHYRSHFSIIEFSNRQWYSGYLDIRTNYDNLFYPPEGKAHLEWINIKGETLRKSGRSAYNEKEAELVVSLLDKFISYYQGSNHLPSFGIVTPFTAQAELLKELIIKRYDEQLIKNLFLIADTAHKFQGDERDIVLFSPVISSNVPNDSTLIGFLRSTSNLFNVAITRARSILWVVGDKQKCINSSIPFLKDFVEYIEHRAYEKTNLPYDKFDSYWEKKFYEVLVSHGYKPIPQYPAGPYLIDLAIITESKKIAIEIDGERWHQTLSGERLERDLTKDKNLIRMGFVVLRFWTHDLKYNLSDCINKVEQVIQNK